VRWRGHTTHLGGRHDALDRDPVAEDQQRDLLAFQEVLHETLVLHPQVTISSSQVLQEGADGGGGHVKSAAVYGGTGSPLVVSFRHLPRLLRCF